MSRMKELDIERQNIAEYFVPKKIIYCDPATIVYWRDGSKTVVRVSNGDDFQKIKDLQWLWLKRFIL